MTFDLLDALMRYLKARALLEECSLRDLALELIERGLRAPTSTVPSAIVSELPTVRLGRPMVLPAGALSHAALSQLAQE